MSDYRPQDETRCAFRYRDGRRCCMLRCGEHPELCLYHYRRWLKEHDVDPPRVPIVGPGQLDNPWAVRRSLKHVMRELVSGRMTPKKAEVLSRIGRMLLISTRRPRKRRPDGPRKLPSTA
jgi:hypothetical protein